MKDIENIDQAHAVIHDAGGLVCALQMLLNNLSCAEMPEGRQDLRESRNALIAVGNALERVFYGIAV